MQNWSISEFPIKFRKKFFNTINRSKFSIISFQESFENINNLKYFNQTLNKLSNKFIINLQTFDHYNNSPLNKNNHYILLSKKMKKINSFFIFYPLCCVFSIFKIRDFLWVRYNEPNSLMTFIITLQQLKIY